MKSFSELIKLNKKIRVLGIDDAPFDKEISDSSLDVNIIATICSNTRIEGLLYSAITKDSLDSTEIIIDMIKKSKFFSQLHLIITDGIAVGGFNIIDINKVYTELNIPCIAVMRKLPNLSKFDKALKNLPNYEKRKELIISAGEIFEKNGFIFQVAGENENDTAVILERITDQGKVPEALRLSHLIGSAIKTGESSKRA
ncbi:MAG: DUF99 family protein [Candidatus Sericytochromatia bacterium]